MTRYGVTSREVKINLADAAPETTGTTSGLHVATIIPRSAVIREWSGSVQMELFGPRLKKDGTPSDTMLKVKVSTDGGFYEPAPEWLVDIAAEVLL